MAAHKLDNGRWRVWIDLGNDPADGRRIRRYRDGKTKREAEIKAARLRERHARGENVLDAPRTYRELSSEWLATLKRQGKAVNTFKAYDSASRSQLLSKIGAVPVPQLRTRGLQTIFNELADRLGPSYLAMLKSVLVQSLDFAIEQGDRTDNPAKNIRIPSVAPTIGRSLLPEETRAILIACDHHRYGLAVRLALMGMRRGEIPGLRWEDFDADAGTLTIRRQLQRIDGQLTPIPPKRGKTRTLTLGPKMIAALLLLQRAQAVEREVMGWAESGYIFISSETGGPCSPAVIYESFQVICTAAGITPTRLHNCRHTAATALLADGVDVATVAEVLGHANAQVTLQVYAHALPQRVANASMRLEDIFTEDADKRMRQRHG